MKQADSVAGEALSAWVDDELGEEERAFLYRRVCHDDALRDKWARYHLIGDALRGVAMIPVGDDFANVVIEAIDDEAPAVAAKSRRRAGVVVGSVAAALAVLAVSGVFMTQGDMAPTTAGTVAVADVSSEPGNNNASLRQAHAALERRLDAYLADHNALLARSGRSGMMPFVQMADYRGQATTIEP